MIYYFQFGYHSPEDWKVVGVDPEFDCESTGIVGIHAENEEEARRWGIEIAKWYTATLHGDGAAYSWTEDGYATALDAFLAADERAAEVPRVRVGSFPEFVVMRAYLSD